MPRGPDDEAELVEAARRGDGDAFSTLFRRWFDPCCDVARRILHREDLAAEVAQDVFLVAWDRLEDLRDPAAFGGWVLRSARNRALNRLEREGRSRPVEHDEPVLANLRTDDDPEGAVVAGLGTAEHEALLRAGTAALGEREASVLDLHLRHGMGATELAEELGVTANNAHQLLFRMRRKLGAGMRAWVVFSGGRTDCAGLGAALEARGIDGFGPAAVKVVDRHLGECDDCDRRQSAALAPSAMFAAAPVVALAPGAREATVEALRAAGVPLGADAAVPLGADAAVPLAGDAPGHDGRGGGDAAAAGRRRLLAVVGAAAVALAVLAALWPWGAGEDGTEVVAAGTGPGSTTRPERPGDDPTTTAGPVSTTTTGPPAGAARSADAGALPAPAPTTTNGGLPFTDDAPPAGAAGPPGAPAAGAATPTAPPPPSPPPPAPPPPPATTTTAPPRPPPPPPPTVSSFTATPVAPAGQCVAGFPTRLTWATAGATGVSIVSVGIAMANGLGGLGPSGTAFGCIPTVDPPPGGWRLTASGPGGSTVATAP